MEAARARPGRRNQPTGCPARGCEAGDESRAGTCRRTKQAVMTSHDMYRGDYVRSSRVHQLALLLQSCCYASKALRP